MNEFLTKIVTIYSNKYLKALNAFISTKLTHKRADLHSHNHTHTQLAQDRGTVVSAPRRRAHRGEGDEVLQAGRLHGRGRPGRRGQRCADNAATARTRVDDGGFDLGLGQGTGRQLAGAPVTAWLRTRGRGAPGRRGAGRATVRTAAALRERSRSTAPSREGTPGSGSARRGGTS